MPTHKQKQVFKSLMVDKSGKAVGKAMRENGGYSEKTSLTPSKLTNSEGWRELMEEFLDDKLLAKTHHKLLKSKQERFQLDALNLAYKIKNRYTDHEATGLPPISIVVKQVEAPERKQVDNGNQG
jgi:hypothetical protein